MKLALGTAQFGLHYGIANSSGQTPEHEIRTILAMALQAGIHTMDTAVLYGDSEKTLGRVGVGPWHVVSKLPSLPEEQMDVRSWVLHHVQASLQRLNIPVLHGLLLHRPGQIHQANGGGLIDALQEVKALGWVRKIGVSIYDPHELTRITEKWSVDLVQAPFNAMDQRLIRSGWARQLKTAGVEIHIRSIFLQGLLLLPSKQRPAKFLRWEKLWRLWDSWLKKTGMTAMQACLNIALNQKDFDAVIVGVESSMQLQELIAAIAKADDVKLPDWNESIPEVLINPALWSTL